MQEPATTSIRLGIEGVKTPLSEMSPPGCLRRVWDKEVEAPRLIFESTSTESKGFGGHDVSEEEVNPLVYETGRIKTDAEREFEDILERHSIELG